MHPPAPRSKLNQTFSRMTAMRMTLVRVSWDISNSAPPLSKRGESIKFGVSC